MNYPVSTVMLLALAMPLFAADGPKVHTLTFGKAVVGTSYTKEELKGKLLLVEEWGLR